MADGYDIIGDVHGCAGLLEQLLASMRDERHRGTFQHPSRVAVFVGDLIDRGPNQLDTTAMVRAIVAGRSTSHGPSGSRKRVMPRTRV